MKLDRGQLRDLKELTGYSETFIQDIINPDGKKNKTTRGAKKVLAALEILKQNRKDVKRKVRFKMLDIDLLYVSSQVDLIDFPDDYLMEKFKTSDVEAIWKKCNGRGYF